MVCTLESIQWLWFKFLFVFGFEFKANFLCNLKFQICKNFNSAEIFASSGALPSLNYDGDDDGDGDDDDNGDGDDDEGDKSDAEYSPCHQHPPPLPRCPP